MGILRRLIDTAKAAAKRIFGKREGGYKGFTPELLSYTTNQARELPSLFRLRSGLSKRDRNRTADEFAVKHKLGRAYFTRGLGARTRARRARSLNRDELAIARAKGWVI